jgi:hypothetical protein
MGFREFYQQLRDDAGFWGQAFADAAGLNDDLTPSYLRERYGLPPSKDRTPKTLPQRAPIPRLGVGVSEQFPGLVYPQNEQEARAIGNLAREATYGPALDAYQAGAMAQRERRAGNPAAAREAEARPREKRRKPKMPVSDQRPDTSHLPRR